MGALISLHNADRKLFDELVMTIRDKKGHCSVFEQSFLVDLYLEFGFETMKQVITQCMANDWFKVGAWKRLTMLWKRYGADKCDWAIERMIGRENYSLDTVEGILRNEISAWRKMTVTTKDSLATAIATAAKKKVEYPTPDHLYNKHAVGIWMGERDQSLDIVFDYFEIASIDENGFQLYRLKTEYR